MIRILDGSVGHLLKTDPQISNLQGLEFKDKFANASYANIACPEIVERIHSSYVAAGADIISTNSFGCTLRSLAKIQGLENKRDELVIQACRIAKRAAVEVSVAGVVPPLGDCYLGAPLDTDTMYEEYRSLISLMYSEGVDIILCETMSSSAEAIAAARQAIRYAPGKELFVSFTLDDTLEDGDTRGNSCRIRNGESLESAVTALLHEVGWEHIHAVLLNCSGPAMMHYGLVCLKRVLQGIDHIHIGAYANGFDTTTTEWLIQEGYRQPVEHSRHCVGAHGASHVTSYVRHAQQWIRDGATIIGGCCGTTPDYIARLKESRDANAVSDGPSPRPSD